MHRTLCLLAALSLFGCTGQLRDGLRPGEDAPASQEIPTTPAQPGTPVVPQEPELPEVPQAFERTRDKLTLLPFKVRHQRLAALAERPLDDAIFDALDYHRYELGDFNYAQGIRPDRTWTASKLATWVRALRPFCESSVMREKYESRPNPLRDLIEDAYGRPATPAEETEYQSILAEENLEPNTLFPTACIAILSSTEFVAQ